MSIRGRPGVWRNYRRGAMKPLAFDCHRVHLPTVFGTMFKICLLMNSSQLSQRVTTGTSNYHLSCNRSSHKNMFIKSCVCLLWSHVKTKEDKLSQSHVTWQWIRPWPQKTEFELALSLFIIIIVKMYSLRIKEMSSKKKCSNLGENRIHCTYNWLN